MDYTKNGYVVMWNTWYSERLPLWFSVSVEKVLMKTMRPEHFIFSILEGLISGIPLCCVLSYTLHFRSPLMKSLPDNVQYVPCHKCLKKKHFRYIK
jgi:hypothetical protein